MRLLVALLVLLILTGSHCKKDPDLNQPWQAIDLPYKGPLMDVQFLNKDIGYILGAGAEGSNYYNVLLKTTDGGKTWSLIKFSEPEPGGVVRLFTLSSNEIFTIKNGAYRSIDGGVTWEKISPVFSSGLGFIGGIYYSDSRHGVLAQGESFYLTDNGSTFTEVPVQTSGTSLKNLQSIEGVLYATAGSAPDFGVLLKSTDGGQSWQNLSFSAGFISSLHFVNKNVGYILSKNNIYQTMDGGVSWKKQSSSPMPSNVAYLGFFDKQRGIYATWEGKIYETENEGYTWKLKKEIENVGLSRLKVSFNKAVIIGTGGTLLMKEL